MKTTTLETIREQIELLDSKINTLSTVQTMLTTVLFSSSNPHDKELNESIISMLKHEKELKSDIREYIETIQKNIKRRPAKKFVPPYLRAIQGGRKDSGIG